jgi:hypothetical protein
MVPAFLQNSILVFVDGFFYFVKAQTFKHTQTQIQQVLGLSMGPASRKQQAMRSLSPLPLDACRYSEPTCLFPLRMNPTRPKVAFVFEISSVIEEVSSTAMTFMTLKMMTW